MTKDQAFQNIRVVCTNYSGLNINQAKLLDQSLELIKKELLIKEKKEVTTTKVSER
jgi:hypothetical protein